MRGKYRRDAFPGRPCKGTYNQAGAGRGGRYRGISAPSAVIGQQAGAMHRARDPLELEAGHVPRGR
jgi:hypothetical protein